MNKFSSSNTLSRMAQGLHSSSQRKHAFTLAELLGVLLILGIIAGIIIFFMNPNSQELFKKGQEYAK
ncbi:MAG: prepilin-type N-terminal cleavage/methylation domain-containing protein [Lentisphaeria bacterium]|nr:prepilin-type N-terminal cleavage/methylation domain-containing protein [Lentisphaeria bacterium]